MHLGDTERRTHCGLRHDAVSIGVRMCWAEATALSKQSLFGAVGLMRLRDLKLWQYCSKRSPNWSNVDASRGLRLEWLSRPAANGGVEVVAQLSNP